MIPSGRHAVSTDQPARLAAGTTLSLAGVADSRCPPDVTCIWPGRIEYRFELASGERTQSFTLTSDAPAQRVDLLQASVSLVLASVPPALPSKAAKPSRHTVEVEIQRN